MKKNVILKISAIVMVALFLSACAAGTEVSQSESAAQPEAAQVESSPEQSESSEPTESEMHALIEEKIIGSTHTLNFILSQDKTAEEWSETIDRMIGYGAKISEEEKALLIEWLVNR